MIFEVIAGLTVLGEAPRYSTTDLVGITLGIIIACGGIFVLGYKKTSMEERMRAEESHENTQGEEASLLLDKNSNAK